MARGDSESGGTRRVGGVVHVERNEIEVVRRRRLEPDAVVRACGNPSASLVDGGYGSAEMDRDTVAAALGCEMLDERAVTLRDPPVLTFVAGHPFVAQCEGAGTARVGRVVALDRSCDGSPQLIELPIGKMRLQEFGDRQIGFHRLQGSVKPIRMRQRRRVGQ